MLFQKFLKYSSYLLITFLMTTKVHAVTNSGYEVRNWLEDHVSRSLVAEIEIQINEEKRERVIKSPLAPNIDFGYSFPGLNDVRQLCLEEISKFKKKNGTRPRVAEIGPGFGLMTWKLLTAGANVDAFEISHPTSQQLSARINQLNPLFWNNSKLRDILDIYSEDALIFLQDTQFEEKYDFVWIGNVIHFLSPQDFKKMCTILFKILKPEGKIFLEANSIFSLFEMFENGEILKTAYENALEQNLEFPGLFATNTANLIFSKMTVTNRLLVSVVNQKTLLNLKDDFKMTAYQEGYLMQNEFDVQSNEIDKKISQKVEESSALTVLKFHQTTNYMTRKVINDVFSEFGFVILDNFYSDFDGKRKNEEYHSPVVNAILLKPIASSQSMSQKVNFSTHSHHKMEKCATCLIHFSSLKKCSVCMNILYCSSDCQKKDWPKHKRNCKK